MQIDHIAYVMKLNGQRILPRVRNHLLPPNPHFSKSQASLRRHHFHMDLYYGADMQRRRSGLEFIPCPNATNIEATVLTDLLRHESIAMG